MIAAGGPYFLQWQYLSSELRWVDNGVVLSSDAHVQRRIGQHLVELLWASPVGFLSRKNKYNKLWSFTRNGCGSILVFLVTQKIARKDYLGMFTRSQHPGAEIAIIASGDGWNITICQFGAWICHSKLRWNAAASQFFTQKFLQLSWSICWHFPTRMLKHCSCIRHWISQVAPGESRSK